MIDATPRGSPGAPTAGPAAYVVVCRGPHCREHGSLPFRKRLIELLRREPRVGMVGYACFGQCDYGPNVAFFPEGTWYGGLNTPQAAEAVARHAAGSQRLDAQPLSLPEPERMQHLENIGELIRTIEGDRRRARRWWWPL